MKIEIIKSGYGYKKGDIVDVPFHDGQLLIVKGFAKIAPPPAPEKVVKKPKK